MALSTYVDDSGSEPSSLVYVLGGVCLPTSRWDRIAEEWNAVLADDPPVEYLKASEVWERNIQKSTPFVNLTDEQRRRKIDALVDLITAYHPMMMSFELEWSVFKAFKQAHQLPFGKDDPYFYLYYCTILLQAQWGIREANATPVNFIFDNQGPVGDAVLKWYPTFKANCPSDIQSRLGDNPDFKDEKVTVPLQSSDLFAWYARRNTLGTLNGDWHRSVWDRFARYYSRGILEMDNLVNIWDWVGSR